jgi:hypothetical protein
LANKFDRDNYPAQEPYQLQLGDRWVWKREDLSDDYPTNAYALSYEFNIVDGSTHTNFTISATEVSDVYYVEVGSSTTANYTKGNYQWFAYITRSSDSERIMIDDGFLEVIDNYATTTSDIRSHAKVVLDAIEAVIENRATIDQQSMSIAGRSLSRMSIDDLLNFRNQYKNEYLRELKKARVKNGSSSGSVIRVKF